MAWLFIRTVLLCLSLGLLPACKVSLPQRSQLANLKAAPDINYTIKQEQKHSSFLSTGDWPQKSWWAHYNSPELNALIAEALRSNPSLQEVQERIKVARQEAVVTGSLLFPLIFFDAADSQQYLSKNGLFRAFNPKLPHNAKVIDLSLSFTYEFDFWGQNRNRLRAALGEAKAAEAEAAGVELIVATALSQAFFAYKTNLLRKQLYSQLVDLRKRIADLQNLLLHKGLASKLPYFLASENFLEARKWLASIEEELSNNKHLINILAGRNPDSPLDLSLKLPALAKQLEIPRNLSLDLIARRPDLMAQIWRAKALAYKTGVAMAAYYPNVNLMSLMGLESVAWKKLFDFSSGTAALKPALHLPIFTAGAIRANILASKAEFDAAIFAYNGLLLRSTQEILDVLVFAQTAYQHKKEQTKIVYYAQERANLVALREKKGLDSQLDLYSLQEEVIRKKLVNLNLLYNQYLASIKLTKALGGGYYQPQVPLVQTT